MKMCHSRMFLRLMLLASFLVATGCAQQMKSVQSDTIAEGTRNAEIQGVVVSSDGSRISISSDKPIVYTYYPLESPPRLVIDLAQTVSGALPLPIEVNRGKVKRIDITRHEFGSGVLSRVEVSLAEKGEAVVTLDPEDKKKLIIAIDGGSTDKTAEAASRQSVPPVAVEDKRPDKPVLAGDTAVPPVVEPVAKPVTTVPDGEAKAITGDKSVAEVKSAIDTPPAESSKQAPTIPESQAVPPVVPVSPPIAQTIAVPIPVKAGERLLTAITKGSDGVNIDVAGGVDVFKAFKLGQPERLVVDIPGARNGIASKVADINSFNLGKARIGVSPDKVRVVFDATAPLKPYSVTKRDNGLLVAFGESAIKAAALAPRAMPAPPVTVPVEKAEPVAPPAPAEKPLKAAPPVAKPAPVAAPKGGAVESIDFQQQENIARITLKIKGDCVAGTPVKTAKGISLPLAGCQLPVKLQRRLDTTAFGSVVQDISPYPVKVKRGAETRVALKLRRETTTTVSRDGQIINWDIVEPVKPVKTERIVRSTKPVLTAKPVKAEAAKPAVETVPTASRMEREFVDVKPEPQKPKAEKALEEAFVLEKASQPVTRPGKVYTGRKVSLEFSDADIRKIFQLLAEVSNQNFLISDDVTGTISLKLVNVPWDQALDVILENKGLGMQKEGNIVQIRPKTKMKSLDDEAIEMRLTEEKRMPLSTVIFDINFATLSDIETQFKNLKSKRSDSSISSDLRTNKIIVVDIDPNIRKMRSLLESLDVPEKQVMIEARIVEASTNFARDIGVKWNSTYQDASASVANINSLTTSMGGVVSSVLPTATTGGLAAGMSFGKLMSNIQLDLRLSAASTVGQVKIISTPKVLTVNNKPAKISQGQMIPYQNTSSTEGAKTEFIEAALSLEVTPHITSDGSVNMKIKASNNTAGVGSPPPINKKEATTELVVKNGETTVIGGIYVDSETEGDTGVPYISDIPLLGWLFKSNAKNKTKNELLIFITPKIMN